MQIKMKTLAAGPDGVRHPGIAYDVPDDVAAALIDAGAADPLHPRIEPAPEPEPAQIPASDPTLADPAPAPASPAAGTIETASTDPAEDEAGEVAAIARPRRRK
jgi:hypothetical protein